jgi:hypothetical protein
MCRVFQPDTRSMWSSYQPSTAVRDSSTDGPLVRSRLRSCPVNAGAPWIESSPVRMSSTVDDIHCRP